MNFSAASHWISGLVILLVFALTPGTCASTVFAVIGDYGVDNPNTQAVANLVKNKFRPEFIVTTGDNNYEGPDDIDHVIGKFYHQFIGSYKGGYGPGAVSNAFFPSLGNHDYKEDGYAAYLDYFDLPGNGRYYDVARGPVHLFILNSDEHEPDGIQSNSVQARWLSARLAASMAAWKIVVFHHTPYSSSIYSPSMRWPFREWGADVVLAGHAHNYERVTVDGFPYFVNGLGGHSISEFGPTIAGSAARYNSDYGAMQVMATDTQITFEFHSIEGGGILIDSHSLQKETGFDAASLQVLNLEGDELQISWPASLRESALQSTANLDQPDWKPIDATPVEADGIVSVVLPVQIGRQFFRLLHE